MNKAFTEIFAKLWPDATEQTEFSYDDLRQAFEEGHHLAKDEFRQLLHDILEAMARE